MSVQEDIIFIIEAVTGKRVPRAPVVGQPKVFNKETQAFTALDQGIWKDSDGVLHEIHKMNENYLLNVINKVITKNYRLFKLEELVNEARKRNIATPEMIMKLGELKRAKQKSESSMELLQQTVSETQINEIIDQLKGSKSSVGG